MSYKELSEEELGSVVGGSLSWTSSGVYSTYNRDKVYSYAPGRTESQCRAFVADMGLSDDNEKLQELVNAGYIIASN